MLYTLQRRERPFPAKGGLSLKMDWKLICPKGGIYVGKCHYTKQNSTFILTCPSGLTKLKEPEGRGCLEDISDVIPNLQAAKALIAEAEIIDPVEWEAITNKLRETLPYLEEAERILAWNKREFLAKEIREIRLKLLKTIEEAQPLQVSSDDIDRIIALIPHDNPDDIKPFAWTECEKQFPEVREKLERCVMKVKERLPKWCLEEEAWGETRQGETCYNPWAVCRASIKCPPEE